MARYTTSAAVKAVLIDDYGPRDDGTDPDLYPFIETASAMVDRVDACRARKGLIAMVAAEREILTRWLAAYYYTAPDPIYASRSTAGASGSFVREPDCPNPYKRTALDLDDSGCLNALMNKQRASAVWLGKTEAEQLSYDDRNGT